MKFLFYIGLLLPTICFSQRHSSIDFGIDLNLSYRILKTNSEDVLINQILDRRNSETPAINPSFSFGYNKPLNNRVILKSGIDFLIQGNITKRNNLRWPSEITPDGFKPDPNLPHEIRFKSNYYFISIPINLRIENKIKVLPYFEFGISPSFLTAIGSKSIIEKTFRKPNKNLNRIFILSNLSLGYNINLKEKYQFFIQNTFFFNFISLVNSPIHENLYSNSIRIGMRYYLEMEKE